MKYLLILILFLFFGVSGSLVAQVSLDSTSSNTRIKTRELSMNMTPLLTMLIPFNRANPRIVGPYMIQTIRYKGDNFFRFSLGADLSDIGASGENAHVNFRFGWGKRRYISKKLSYLISGDLIVSLGDLNIQGVQSNGGSTFGIGPTWGLQYRISDKVNIGTDTALLIGLNTDGFGIIAFEFIPPVSVFLNFQIPPKKNKKKRRRSARISDSDWYN